MIAQKPAIRLGVIGPSDLVERIIRQVPMRLIDTPSFQLIPGVYENEAEAVTRVLELEDDVDGFLFTGPVPYHLVQGKVPEAKTMSFVPLSGASLFAAVTRCVLRGTGDPRRVSIDCMDSSDVIEGYEDLGLGGVMAEIQIAPRNFDEDVDALVAFHVSARASGASLAFTGVRSVHERLGRLGVPSLRVVPVSASIRSALRAAVLRTAGQQFEVNRVWVGVLSIDGPDPLSALAGEEADEWALATSTLRKWARSRDGMAFPISSWGAVVVWTQGSASDIPADTVAEIQAIVGDGVEVRVGSGDSVMEAYRRAVDNRGHSIKIGRADGDHAAFRAVAAQEQVPPGYWELARALKASAVPPEEAAFVSASMAADILRLSERQARRLLDSLVTVGLAWPLPPQRDGGPGRPRRSWRLLLDSD